MPQRADPAARPGARRAAARPGARRAATRASAALCSAVVAAVAATGCSVELEPPGADGTAAERPRDRDDRRRSPAARAQVDAVVERVVDGDTIVIAGTGSVRLIGIDAPEAGPPPECHADASTAYVREALPRGTRVTLRLGAEPRDRYGRMLAYVLLADGGMLNERLARLGHARTLEIAPNVEHAPALARAARRARAERAGVWACPPGAAGRVRCSDFSTRAEAERHLRARPSDADRIDGDGDGRPCETLP